MEWGRVSLVAIALLAFSSVVTPAQEPADPSLRAEAGVEAEVAVEPDGADDEAREGEEGEEEEETEARPRDDGDYIVFFGAFGAPLVIPTSLLAAPVVPDAVPVEADRVAERPASPESASEPAPAERAAEPKVSESRDAGRDAAVGRTPLRSPYVIRVGDVEATPSPSQRVPAATPHRPVPAHPAPSSGPGPHSTSGPQNSGGPQSPGGPEQLGGPEPLSVPTFLKVFSPDLIGPGSTSRLTFTITNPDATGVIDMAFTDTLPAGMTLAAPGFDRNTCGGTVTADDGSTTVALADGTLEAMASCIVRVNVTAGAAGGMETTYMNVSGDLTSSAGNSGSAADDLTVKIDRPGFTKVFSPSSVAFGGRSTLTFTIDNALNASGVADLDFTDNLPPGMVVASPSNKTTTCISSSAFFTTVLTAVPGSSTITLDANGSPTFPVVAAGAFCTVSVDVIGGAVGDLGNVSGELFSAFFGVSSGRAANVLEVTGFADLLSLEKEFIDDPVAPGGTTTLRFIVTNRSRDDSASSITFTDDLEMTLTGLAPSGPLPTDPCGAGSSLSFSMGDLTLTGGSLGPGESCTFDVTLLVPSGATPATYSNTAGPVMGDVGGSPETGNIAADQLFVVTFPALGKEWTDDPVGAGDSVTLEFTIQNTSTASAMSSIAFEDQLTSGAGDPSEGGGVGPQDSGFLPFPVSVTLPGGSPCGGSVSLVSCGTDCQAISLTGGSLDANDGMAGGTDECDFTVIVDIPVGFPGGSYLNTTQEITAVLDDITGTPTVEGPPASDTLVVEGTPTLTKEFTDDPVAPGGSVTLLFTLSHDEAASGDATAIAFDDPLVPAGLTATAVPTNTCAGSTVDITTDPTVIDFSGGSLMPDTECSFSVTISVPGGAPSGVFTNTTSDVTATVSGVMAIGNPAEDDLLIAGLLFSKSFTDDPAIAGGPVTLMFTLDNTLGTVDATGISFSDDLSTIIPPVPGVTTTGPSTPPAPCGGTLTDIGGTFLSFTGGAVLAGTSCSFTVPLLVPATIDPDGGGPMPPFPTPDDAYTNVTSTLTATIGGPTVFLPPAVDELIVQTTNLALDKEFTDDPAVPGGTVTLLFTLENIHPTGAASAIAFTDDLGAALAGLTITSELTNTCGGTVGGVGTGMFSYTGGSLAASDGMPGGPDTCAIELLLTLPPGPIAGDSFPNTTSGVTGTIGGLPVTGDPASDTLEVDTVTFTKSFADPAFPGGTVLLTFTITNLDSTGGVTPISFGDNLDAVISGLVATGLPASDVCGSGSTLSGTSFLSLTGATLAAAGSAGDSCTFDVTLSVPVTATAGEFLNTTTPVTVFGLSIAAPAIDFLTVGAPPTFTKVFAPDTILAGEVSTLTFTIDNTASTFAASSLAFTDVLPPGVVIASPPGTTNSCGGTVTAVAGADTITLSGGMVADGAVCMISVDVTSVVGGAHVNLTGDLTSSNGNSGPATDTLTVTPLADLSVTLTPRYDPPVAGAVQLFDAEVMNAGPSTPTDVMLDVELPPGSFFLGAEPTVVPCTLLGGILVSCDIGPLPPAGATTVTIGVLIDPRFDGTRDSEALVGSSLTDPALGNNEDDSSLAVARPRSIVATTKADGTEILAMVLKEADATLGLLLAEAAGGGDRKYSVTSTGFRATALAEVPDFDDTPAPEIAVLGFGFDGSTKVDVIDADSAALLSSLPLLGTRVPIDVVALPDFGGTPAPDLAVLQHDPGDGSVHVSVIDAADGSLLIDHAVTDPGDHFPLDLDLVPDFDGTPTPELGIVTKNSTSEEVRVHVIDGSSGAALGTSPYLLGADLFPFAINGLDDVGGAPAPDVAVLVRKPSTGEVKATVIDASTGGAVNDVPFDPGLEPADMITAPDFAGTPAPELAVLGRTGFDMVVEIKDAGDDLLVGLLFDSDVPKAPVPLGLAVHPDFAGGPEPEVSVLFEFDIDPAQVDVFNAAGGAPLFNFFLP